MRQAPPLEVRQRAAAEIDDEGHAVAVGDGRQLRLGHGLGEALHGVVAGVHLHQHGGARTERFGEVPGMGAVGGADLDQPGAGALHDVGDAEGAADLDQFAARDDDFLA